MFSWFKKKRVEGIDPEVKKSFDSVKNDFEHVGKWLKHLDEKDKQLLDMISLLKMDLSSIKDEIDGVKEELSLMNMGLEGKQLFKKQTAVYKQEAVYPVEEPVQTAVQTGNIALILDKLTANERLLVLALLNTEDNMKLSYEDLARLVGKEKSTVRGQINAIKRKSESLVMEMSEANGKKRVFIPREIKEKLLKYAKVRVAEKKKSKKSEKKEEEKEAS